MKFVKSKFKIRCETGGCKNYSDYVLYMDRCGVHSSVYICEGCVQSLKEAVERLEEEKFCPEEEKFPIADFPLESVLTEKSREKRDSTSEKQAKNRKKTAESNKTAKTDVGEESGE